MGLFKAERRLAGLGCRELEGATRNAADPQRPHELEAGQPSEVLVCHSRSCGFLDFWPTMGFFTTASLKWSTTAAMAKTPPSRSYRLFSGTVCLSCACALSAAANTVTGAAASASPATTFRLVIEVETVCDMATSLARKQSATKPNEMIEHSLDFLLLFA